MAEIELPTGQKMPLLILGTYDVQEDEIERTLINAINTGYRHIDTASAYHNEAIIGDTLTHIFKSQVVSRDQLFLTSKVWPSHYRDVKQACINSLKRLKVDYLDLYLLHWPLALKYDDQDPPKVEFGEMELDQFPLQAVWSQMEELVELKLVKHIGVCNWTVALLNDMMSYARIPPIVNQIEVTPYLPRSKLVDFCKKLGVVPCAYRDIYGLSSHKRVTDDETLAEVAQKHHKTPAQVLLKWCLVKGCAPIVKCVCLDTMRHYLDSASLELTQEDIQAIDSISTREMHCDPYELFGIQLFD